MLKCCEYSIKGYRYFSIPIVSQCEIGSFGVQNRLFWSSKQALLTFKTGTFVIVESFFAPSFAVILSKYSSISDYYRIFVTIFATAID